MNSICSLQNIEEYYPGDTIGILTQNLASDVNFMLERFHLVEIADCVYEVRLAKPVKRKNPEIPPYVPKFITPRRLLSECLDFRIIPRKVRFDKKTSMLDINLLYSCRYHYRF